MEPSWLSDPPPPPPPAAEPPSHMAHAANPTPPAAPNNLPSHPPYAEMITAAITALKEKDGSSRQAIAKYIEKAYPNLPATHSALLTHHLKRLKNNGLLVMVKYSYMLPRSVPISSTTTTTVTANGNDSSSGPKRGPGRPPKPKMLGQPDSGVGPEMVLVPLSSGVADGPGPTPTPIAEAKKGPGRGRPPRAKSGAAEFGGPVVVGKRGRGRPPRPKSMAVLMGQNGLKKGRGRPPRTRPIGSAGLPRPKKAVSAMKVSGRPRGRPPKNTVSGAAFGGGGGGGAVVVAGVLAGKRRGRPPKAGAVKKPRKLTGKPLGRPKKNASMAAIQAVPTQQLVAYEDLRNKIEHFQSRVRYAVSVVKPHLNQETAVGAIGALQELEALATMDVNAPLNVQVPVQVQEPLLHY